MPIQREPKEQVSPVCLDRKPGPSHYKQGDIEVIDFIQDQRMDFIEGNIIKYLCRYKFKDGIEDLQKAKHYLDMLIDRNELAIHLRK